MQSTWTSVPSSDSKREISRRKAGRNISSAYAVRLSREAVLSRRSTPFFRGMCHVGAGMSSSAALESTYAYALNDLLGLGIDKFELARIGQSTEHNYVGVKCGIMDQFASIFGKKGHLIRLDTKSMDYAYFPFDPEGYKLVLLDTAVKHELASSAYNKRRESCEHAARTIAKRHPEVEYLRDASLEMLYEVKEEISAEDFMRASVCD